MKWMLISIILNSPITYSDQTVCEQALAQVKTQDKTAMCIPAGETEEDKMMLNIFNLIDKFRDSVEN